MSAPKPWEVLIKTLSLFIAAGALFWTAYSFVVSSRIEAARPYLEKQLNYYIEATRVASQPTMTLSSTQERERGFLSYSMVNWP